MWFKIKGGKVVHEGKGRLNFLWWGDKRGGISEILGMRGGFPCPPSPSVGNPEWCRSVRRSNTITFLITVKKKREIGRKGKSKAYSNLWHLRHIIMARSVINVKTKCTFSLSQKKKKKKYFCNSIKNIKKKLKQDHP